MIGSSSSAAGRRAIVTGGGSGIGLAVVQHLATAGSQVVAADIREGTREAVTAAGGELVVTDVSDPQAWTRLLAEADRRIGGVDFVLLNAGIPLHQPDVATAPIELVERVVATNMWGVVHGLRAVVPLLAVSGGGDVVVTSSLAGIRHFSDDPYYAMTKHAVVGLARSCAKSLAAQRIRVTVICPGLIDTPLVPIELRARTIAAGRALVPPARAAEHLFAAVDAGGTGRVWTIQDRPGLQEYVPALAPMD